MPNAGTIEADVRLSLKNMRKDVQNLDLLMKMGTSNFAKELNNITVYAELMQRKTGKTLQQYAQQIKAAQALFVRMYKSVPEEETATREALKKTILQLQEARTKLQNYSDLEAKRAVKRKEEAAQLKAIERANIEAVREKERVAKQNALAERQRHALEMQQEREKQMAYERSLKGRVASYLGNLKLLIVFRSLNRIISTVTKGIRELVNVSIEYEASLANTQAVAQATAEGLNKLDEAAQKAGMTTKFTASEAAEGLYELASAGFDAYEATDALNGVLLMAAATSEGVADTAQLVAATIRQFRMEALEADRVANVLTASISTSQATMTKLKTSLTQAGTVASGLNISLEEMIGMLDLMYDSGMQASRAGRAMRNALAEMSNENSRTVNKLKEMGIAFEDIDLNSNSLVEAFGSLADAGLSTGQVMEAFGKVIGPQMMILVRSSRQELEKYVDKVTGTNRAHTAAATQLDNLKGDILLLKSAWQALGITLSKIWIPVARKVVDIGIKVTRSVNRLTSDVLGLTTTSEKYVRIADKMATSTDEYKRLTDLLTNSTEDLTQAQKDLYAAELERSKFGIINSLRELNNEYDAQKESLDIIQSAVRVTDMEKRRINYYEELGRKLNEYDTIQKNHNTLLKLNRNAGTSMSESTMSAYLKTINDLEDEIMGLYSTLTYVDTNIRDSVQFLSGEEGLSRQAKDATKDIIFFNSTLYDIPKFMDDEHVLRYAKSFGELSAIMKDAPLWREWLNDAATGTETYINKSVELERAINLIHTELSESERDVNDVIEQTARYLNAEILQEEDLLRYAPKLAKAIKERAEELKQLGAVEEKNIVITAGAYQEMLKQLELSNEVRKALDEDIASTQESINKNIEKAQSTALINAAYEIQVENARRAKEATIAESEARAELAREELEAKRQAEQSTDAEEGLTEATDESTMASLENAIATNAANEATAAEEALAYAVTQAEKARVVALYELGLAIAETERERKSAYNDAISTSTTYTKKLEEARDKELADYKAIVEAEGVFGIDKIEENTEKRIEIQKQSSARELDELKAKHAEQATEINATYAERTAELEKALAEDLRVLNEYYELEVVRNKNATALAVEEENAKYEMLKRAQEEYFNADIAALDNKLAKGEITQAEYKAKYTAFAKKANDAEQELEKEHNDKLASIEKEGLDNELAIKEITDEAIEAREAEHAEAMVAESEAMTSAQKKNAQDLSAEQVAQAEYAASEEKRIANEASEAKREAWNKTLNDFQEYISQTQQMLDAINALYTANTDAQIANIDRRLKAEIKAIEVARDAELEAAGFRLDTERETLEKAIESARESADEQAIIDAERALEKFEIEEKAREDTKAAEDKAAKEMAERQYKLAMVQYKFGIADIMMNTAKAVMQMWASPSLRPWERGVFSALVASQGVAQLAAAKVAKPVKEDYFATGGIVRGTPEGTHAIVGEKNRTEAIFNPDQMANLLMAIAQGQGGSGSSSTTFIFKNMYDKEVAKYVIEDCVNNGVYLVDPQKGIKKVAR